MSTSSIKLGLAALLALIAITPPAIGAGKSAVDYIVSSYLVMYVQMDGLRLWCF